MNEVKVDKNFYFAMQTQHNHSGQPAFVPEKHFRAFDDYAANDRTKHLRAFDDYAANDRRVPAHSGLPAFNPETHFHPFADYVAHDSRKHFRALDDFTANDRRDPAHGGLPAFEPRAHTLAFADFQALNHGIDPVEVLPPQLRAFADLPAYEQWLALHGNAWLQQRLLLVYAAHDVQCAAERWCRQPALFSTIVWTAARCAMRGASDTIGANEAARQRLLRMLATLVAHNMMHGEGCSVCEMFLLELCQRYKTYVCAWDACTGAELAKVRISDVRRIVSSSRAFGAEAQLRDLVLQLLHVYFARPKLAPRVDEIPLEPHLTVPAGTGTALPASTASSPFARARSAMQARVVRDFLCETAVVFHMQPLA